MIHGMSNKITNFHMQILQYLEALIGSEGIIFSVDLICQMIDLFMDMSFVLTSFIGSEAYEYLIERPQMQVAMQNACQSLTDAALRTEKLKNLSQATSYLKFSAERFIST